MSYPINLTLIRSAEQAKNASTLASLNSLLNRYLISCESAEECIATEAEDDLSNFLEELKTRPSRCRR